MAKSIEKIKAQILRKRGESIKVIAKRLSVSKGAVSRWCRDIELSSEQVDALNKRRIKGGYAGRLKGARMQRERKLALIRDYDQIAQKVCRKLSRREFLLTGVALYWGEGTKTDTRIGFANSDPALIRFIMKWFREVMYVSDERFSFTVIINETHKHRIREVESFWAGVVGCSKDRFKKSAFVKAKNKKVYLNAKEHFGTLHIYVHRGVHEKYKILGLINALGDYT